MTKTAEFCSDEALLAATQAAERDTSQGLRKVEALLSAHGLDPRLHFLKGSLLAALQRYGDAEGAMRQAIELAPGFDIARFQLGLLLLSSGAVAPAAEVWGPLSELDPVDPLRLFAEGLQHMARNDLPTAERLLRDGMARNREHPTLNNDMQMMLDRFPTEGGDPPGEASSEAHWLLQVAGKSTRH